MSNEASIQKSSAQSADNLAHEYRHVDGMLLGAAVPSPRWEHESSRAVARAPSELYCPFRSGVNVNARAAQAASVEWASRMGLIRDQQQSARLEAAKIAWLEAFVLQTATLETLQLAADWTTLFCMLDDEVEGRKLGPIQLSTYLSSLMTEFRRPLGTTTNPIARGLADVSRRMHLLGGAASVERFAERLDELFGAYVWEEINRWKQLRPSRDVYQSMRIVTIGLRPQFVLAEIAEDIQLSETARVQPDLVRLEHLTCRAVGWANDLFTHEKELEQGEMHNLVLVLMDAESRSLHDAVERAKALHDSEIRSFLAIEAGLSGLGEDRAVYRYVSMLRRWIRGHLDWAVKTGRYRERHEPLATNT
jgi:hypothetical protein